MEMLFKQYYKYQCFTHHCFAKSIYFDFQTRREVKPKEENIEHYRPQGEEFEKAYAYQQKPRRDETEISERRVKSEKITVSGGEIPRTEETNKPTYPKAIDIGRIVINETPKEKQPLQKRDIPKRDKVKETQVDVQTCDKFDDGSVTHVKEDVVKVGRLNIAEYKIIPSESEKPKVHEMVIYISCNFRKMLFRSSILSAIC